MFTPELVKELKPAGMYNYSNGTSNPDKTQVLYKYKHILLWEKNRGNISIYVWVHTFEHSSSSSLEYFHQLWIFIHIFT